jgi:hypothetical protein
MSALGQADVTRCPRHPALPPKADIRRYPCDMVAIWSTVVLRFFVMANTAPLSAPAYS